MKANYGNKKVSIKEKSVLFRVKKKDDRYSMFCLYQSNIYGNIADDKGVVYLDFENEEQIERLIGALTRLKDNLEETKDDSTAES